MANCTRHS